MGFGAIITSGDNNTPLREELLQWLVETRIEQELSKPSKFAMRFEDDICGDQPAVAGAEELKSNSIISIIAPLENKRFCLIRGRITQIKSSTKLGGTGSWLEVHGEDRRVEMSRNCIQATWTGRASEAASAIIEAYDYETDTEQTSTVYEENGNTLSQRSTDIAFLEKIASENSMELWINYDVPDGDANPLETDFSITEIANLKTSPPTGANEDSPVPPTLTPTTDIVFRINVTDEQCPNVTAFDAEVDSERPNAAHGTTVNSNDLSVDDAGGENQQPAMGEGNGIVEIDGVERSICIASPGESDEQRRRQQAALTEASWFVEVSLSTTANMLSGILVPHDIIEITAAGAQLSGPYQVKEVIHVVTASDHFMDIKLRSNVLGEA